MVAGCVAVVVEEEEDDLCSCSGGLGDDDEEVVVRCCLCRLRAATSFCADDAYDRDNGTGEGEKLLGSK
jgi:hypothetical protein